MSKLPHPLYIVAGLGVLAYLFRNTLLQAVNPVNNQNVISEAVNETLGFKESGSSIGSSIYDIFHPAYDPNE